MKFMVIALALSVSLSSTYAAEPEVDYRGQETRELKALSPDQIAGLLTGKGMGYAKVAELNHYPGPAHVLELSEQLKLTEKQLEATRGIHARMAEQAKRLGAQLVEAEAALETLFQTGVANEKNVGSALEHIGQLQAALRGVHVVAHLQQKTVLTQEQISRYSHLRGYRKSSHGPEQQSPHSHGSH